MNNLNNCIFLDSDSKNDLVPSNVSPDIVITSLFFFKLFGKLLSIINQSCDLSRCKYKHLSSNAHHAKKIYIEQHRRSFLEITLENRVREIEFKRLYNDEYLN